MITIIDYGYPNLFEIFYNSYGSINVKNFDQRVTLTSSEFLTLNAKSYQSNYYAAQKSVDKLINDLNQHLNDLHQ